MFGSSLQTQLSQPLSQLISVAGCFRGVAIHSTNTWSKQHQRFEKEKKEDDILCPESFDQAIKNSSNVPLLQNVKLSYEDIQKLSQHVSLVSAIASNPEKKPLPWLQSHISAESFFENKHGFPSWALDRRFLSSVSVNLVNYCPRRNYSAKLYFGPDRGFKTLHSGKGTGLSGGSRSEHFEESSPLSDRIFSLKSKMSERDRYKGIQEAENSEKIRGLVGDEKASIEDQKKIKVAFAEGYLAADAKGGKLGSKFRIFGVLRDILSIIVIVAVIVSLLGTSGSFKVQLGNSNEVRPEEISVTFDDVKGIEEAKDELYDIVEFLRNPGKFTCLGGKLPKGVLLVGPPGTGKTLLARAVAGEAGVPFFHAAGPEFDEILVGQGARRVRDLFSTAKLKAPCVIFIDEIDSVGAKRTNSVLHPYANQTINQLLSEMDGFRRNEGVVVLGATNRREDLDKALLRPGRFDVEIAVPIPDFKGRREIMDLYMSKIKLGADVNIDVLARGTTGFTGADIENLVNQAAVRAAIEQAESVSMKYLEWARDKVLMGPEKKSRLPDEEANLITAYHEGGHALVAFYTRDAHPLHKVTIIPRGHSLGHTSYIPEKERYHVTKAQMLATIDTLMGGRAAEELIFGSDKITSGASSDLKQATAIATNMVKEWGMSEKVGVRTFEDNTNSLVVVNEVGQYTTEAIDAEIRRLLTESYDRAKAILKSHSKEHKLLAEALLKYETLDVEDVRTILNKKEDKRSKDDS